MPSIVTHHYFAYDVLNALPSSIQNIITPSKKIYDIFAQSFDNLFYYQFFTPWKGQKIRSLGNLAQQTKVNEYFKNILDYIVENNYENNSEVLAYLYGSICHYVLDSLCHPYIIYLAGDVNKDLKYRGNHEKIETSLDAYIYQKKEKQELKKATLANTLLPICNFSKPLQETINNAFYKTFSAPNMALIYEKSYKVGHFILKYFVTDKKGIKKRLYTIKDAITKKSHRKYEYLSFHIDNTKKKYVNLNHKTWHHPVTNEPYNDSFLDLYNQSIKEATNKIKAIDKYLNTNKKDLQKLLKIIGNNSYTTGLDCLQKQTLKYFQN